MSVGKRLEWLRGDMSRNAFAKKIGINSNTFRNYEEGLSLPNSDMVAQICAKLNLSFEWFLLGKGDIYKTADMSAINKSNTNDNSLILLESEKNGIADVGHFTPTELDNLRQENTRLYKKVEVLLEENGNLRVEVERLKRLIATGGADVIREAAVEEDKANTA